MILAAIAAASFGCVLEDTEMHKIAPDPQTAVYCPAKTTTDVSDADRILSYIQFTSEEDSGETIKCTSDNCTSKKDCCGLTGNQAELYYLAFKYSICPQDMRCMNDNTTKEHYCEMKETECTGDYVRCNNECYNIMTDNMNCGECNSPCETKNIPNSKTAACIDGKCAAIFCIEGYHVDDNTKECLPDNTKSCGGTDCTKTPGWLSGICEDDICVANACNPGFHTYNQKNENDTYLPCEEDSSTRCGEPYTECESGEGILSMGCEDGYCIITDCINGYHRSNDKDKCEVDTARACGENKDCYSDPTWGNGDGIDDEADGFCTEDRNCYANSCQKGYHPFNENVDSTFIPCQKDDENNCGEPGRQCEGSTPVCNNGECVEKCTSDLVLCGLTCVDLKTDLNNCGKCGNVCPQGMNTKSTCEGTCISTCINKYGDCNNDLSDGCESSFVDRNLKSCATCKENYADCTNKSNIDCNIYLPDKHWTACNKCVSGFGNCDQKDINGCETELAPIHWSECGKCSSGYGNCDNKNENGCEIKLADKNWSKCNTCKSGFADCDGKASNGCEVKLADKNWSDCNTCAQGYDNCDANDANGCETKLDSYALETCSTCKSGYTKCGNVQGKKYASCLRKGNGWDNYNLSFSKYCKKVCNQNGKYEYLDGYDIYTMVCSPKEYCHIYYYYDEDDEGDYWEEYDAGCSSK